MSTRPRPTKCPTCETSLRIPASAAGKTVRCPRCKEPFKIPELAAAVPVLEPLPKPGLEEVFDFSDATAERPQFAHFRVVDPADARSYRLYVGRGEVVGVFVGSDWVRPIWVSIAALSALVVGWGAAKGTLQDGDLTDVATAGAVGAAVGAVGGAAAGAVLGLLLRPLTKADDEREAERLEQLGSKPLSVLRRNHEFNFNQGP